VTNTSYNQKLIDSSLDIVNIVPLLTERQMRSQRPIKLTKPMVVMLGMALVGGSTLTLAAYAKYQDSPKMVVDEAWQIVNNEYVDPTFNQVDWLQVRQTLLNKAYTSRDAAYTALRDALKELNDPYTRFMSPEEFQAFTDSVSGDLVGVGLQLTTDPQTQALKIVAALPDSPAQHSQIQPGDQILKIDGQSTQGMTLEDAVQRIRGQANTSVTLTLQPLQGETYEVTLTRAQIQVPTVDSALRVEGAHRIGYIHLSQFGSHAADEMKQAIDQLKAQGAEEYVLDLRDNPGGQLEQGVAIADFWLDHGKIVRIVNRQGEAEQYEADHQALTDLPLAVLVNGNSASASEIVTGALQDNHRAVIVGTQTFGKGLVQSVHSLSDGSGLNVTIAHYFTPAGHDINHLGITPDRVVSLDESQHNTLLQHPDWAGTAQDIQFQQAVDALNGG
jgi:carboxyl-terminal processing protease